MSRETRPRCCLTEAGLECIGTPEREACGWHGCEDAARCVDSDYVSTEHFHRLGTGLLVPADGGENQLWLCPRCDGECSHTPLDEIKFDEGAPCECRRRFVRMFSPRFAPLVAARTKLQTVRKTPERMPAVGDIFDAREWSGKPYASKQTKLGEFRICDVQPVELVETDGALWIHVNTNSVPADEFAAADGFADAADMFAWFREKRGLPFSGIVIKWEPWANATPREYAEYLAALTPSRPSRPS